MLKRVLLAYAIALAAIMPSKAEPVEPEIIAFCRNLWESDYVMQLKCQEKETAALQKLVKAAQMIKTALTSGVSELEQKGMAASDVVNNCTNLWRDKSGQDWHMTAICVQKQLEALGKLGKF